MKWSCALLHPVLATSSINTVFWVSFAQGAADVKGPEFWKRFIALVWVFFAKLEEGGRNLWPLLPINSVLGYYVHRMLWITCGLYRLWRQQQNLVCDFNLKQQAKNVLQPFICTWLNAGNSCEQNINLIYIRIYIWTSSIEIIGAITEYLIASKSNVRQLLILHLRTSFFSQSTPVGAPAMQVISFAASGCSKFMHHQCWCSRR